MKPLFVFDLDSTITRDELLPMIARKSGLGGEMARLTEQAMAGSEPFALNFPKRAALLRQVPLSAAREIVKNAPLHEKIAAFIRAHAQRCMIVTGNLDVWIAPLMEKLGMQGRCLCSRARVQGDVLLGVESVLDKESVCRGLPRPFLAVGDGSNDIGMLRAADFGVAFGGARTPSQELLDAADAAVCDEDALIALLESYL